MTDYQVQSLGCFMIAAAHYVRNGDDFWYAAWIFSAVILLGFGRHITRSVAS